MNTIENIALKRRVEVSLTGINIATYTAAAIFLPYILSTILLISLAIYIIVNRQTRQQIFINNGSGLLKVFLAYILIVPFLYSNWIGFATGAGVVLAVILGLYLRNIMTGELFEKLLTMICTFSLTSTGYAVIEKAVHIINGGRTGHRIAAVFFHPNYFGTIVGTVVIICAYKVLSKQDHSWYYYLVAAMNVISMYLCKSMFVWVEVFVGVAVLLVIYKRHRLLSIWLMVAAAAAFMIFFLDINIIPRLSDVEVTVRLRRQIWDLTVAQIIKTPLIGHGLYSYMFLFDSTYLNQAIPHSHSIYLDMLLNFGVIGTGMFLVYITKYYKTVTNICFKKKDVRIAPLILAVTAAALIHGITDITLLWVQTLPLFFIILSGLGAFEKNGVYNENILTYEYRRRTM